MPNLSLKPTHKPVRAYYDALAEYAQKGVVHEGAVQTAFQDLLVSCGRQFQWTLVPQYAVKRPKKQPIRIDGGSGITNDPNRLDDQEYIVRLIKQVITVSLETVQIVNDLPDLGLPND